MKDVIPVYGQVRSPRRRPSYDLHVLPPESHLNSARHGSPSLYKARLKVEMFAFAHPFSSLVRDFSHLQFHLPANVPKDDVRCSQSPLTLVASTASILDVIYNASPFRLWFCSAILSVLALANEGARTGVAWRTMLFGMFLHSTIERNHTHVFV